MDLEAVEVEDDQERLWELVDAPVANRTFPDLDALEATLVTRCQTLEQQRRPITTRTRYH